MKKITVLLLFVSLCTFSADFHLGLRLGTQFSSNIVSSNVTKANSKFLFTGEPTLQFGIVGKYGFNKNFALQGEILYKNVYIADTVTNYSQLSFKYLQNAVLFKVLVPLSKDISIFINLGPYVGFLLSNSFSSRSDQEIFRDVNFDKTTSLIGVLSGIGIEFKTASQDIFLFEIRGDLGLNKIKTPTGILSYNSEIFDSFRPYSLSISVAYLFNLSPKKEEVKAVE